MEKSYFFMEATSIQTLPAFFIHKCADNLLL